MYKIYKENIPIYDLRDDELIVLNPNLNLEINKLGSLSFNIYPSHPYFNVLTKRNTVLTVYKDDKTIYKGYIISDEQGIYNDKKIECEGVLGYLNDSIVRPYTFSGTPEEHFINLFNNHNSQVTEQQQLKIGTITVTDPNNYITRSSVNYSSTWDVLNEDLINKLGGYLRVRYEEDGTYVDYLEDFDDTSTQIIEFGENLIDVLVKNNAADVYTAVIPLGAEIDNNGVTERLTIKSVNNDVDYLVNQDAFNLYGLIFAPTELTTWDDVTLPSNLKTKGTSFLNNEAVMLKSSLDVSAIDLNVTDEEIEAFFIYEYVRFVSSVHNINQTYLLQKISIPMDSPQDMKITLGKETNSLTGIEMSNKQNTDNIIEKISIIEKNYTINNEVIQEIKQEVETNASLIEQTDSQIRLDVANEYVSNSTFSEFREQTNTQFTVQADGIEAKFNEVTLLVEEVENETQAQFRELSSYIRGYQNSSGQPVIELGSNTSNIILKILNDRISFTQNGSEVAYISDNTLFITDGTFLNSLRIGNFAFIPRANGSLDFKKAVV